MQAVDMDPTNSCIPAAIFFDTSLIASASKSLHDSSREEIIWANSFAVYGRNVTLFNPKRDCTRGTSTRSGRSKVLAMPYKERSANPLLRVIPLPYQQNQA